MDPLLLGLVVGIATVVMLFSGIPIAIGIPENNITTVAIPTTKPNNKGSIIQTPLIFLHVKLIQIYMTLS